MKTNLFLKTLHTLPRLFPGICTILFAVTQPLRAVEMSDQFALRPVQTGMAATFTGDSTSATLEPGEFAGMHGNARNHTLWAAWTPPVNGWVQIDTLGSAVVNACLSVYTGTSLSQLTPISRGIDPDGTGPNPVLVRFPVTAGTTYQIVADSTLNNPSGDGLFTINLSLTQQAQVLSIPGSDAFDQRQRANGSNWFGVANNQLAGLDAFEPPNIGARSKTVWWEWTAPVSGSVTMDTLQSDFDTTITVYSGPIGSGSTRFSALDEVFANNDLPNDVRSIVEFQTEAGRTYPIQVNGSPNSGAGDGNVILAVSVVPNFLPPGIPGGDLFARRGILQGSSAIGLACTELNGTEPFEPDQIGNRNKTAWWEWTAVADGTVIIDSLGSDFDTTLTVFEGTGLDGLRPLVANNNVPGGTHSELQFMARRGAVYHICLDGNPNTSAGDGNGVIRLNQAVPPPRNLAIYHAVEIEFFGRRGTTYQLQTSEDLIRWHDWKNPVTGADAPIRVFDDTRSGAPRYFRYLER